VFGCTSVQSGGDLLRRDSLVNVQGRVRRAEGAVPVVCCGPLISGAAAGGWGQIKRGELPPRRPVPSKKTLRQTYGIAGGTVDKAMDLLRADWLIRTVPGKGLYVSCPTSCRQRSAYNGAVPLVQADAHSVIPTPDWAAALKP
jgi:GntR family transcriptional regulator